MSIVTDAQNPDLFWNHLNNVYDELIKTKAELNLERKRRKQLQYQLNSKARKKVGIRPSNHGYWRLSRSAKFNVRRKFQTLMEDYFPSYSKEEQKNLVQDSIGGVSTKHTSLTAEQTLLIQLFCNFSFSSLRLYRQCLNFFNYNNLSSEASVRAIIENMKIKTIKTEATTSTGPIIGVTVHEVIENID